MKNIGYVINSLRENGPSRVLISMLNGIDKKKYKVIVITLINENDQKIIDKLKKQGIEIVELNYEKNMKTLLKGNEIKKELEKRQLDLVHIHGHITLFLCRKIKVKKVVTIHNRLYEDFKVAYGPIKGIVLTLMNLYYLKKCDKSVCCSFSSYQLIKGKIKNVTYVRNGISFTDKTKQELKNIRKKIREELGIPCDSVVYLYAGNFTKTKRVIKMFEYFSKYLTKNEYLVALGGGKLYDECMKYHSNQVRIVGFKKNVEEYMIASDIYTSFSESEGFSISVIEALNKNLLLLVSDIPSHRECFKINEKIYIGEYFKDNEFLEKKRKVVRYKDEHQSKKFQKEYLSSEYMMKEYEKIYKEILMKGETNKLC